MQPQGRCRGHALAALGGLQFVLPGHILTIDIAGVDNRPARQVTYGEVGEANRVNITLRQ